MTGELTVPQEVQSLYSNTAGAGYDESESGSFPVLRQHKAGSIKNERADGEEIKIGDFFHTGTKESYHDPVVTLLKIKKCRIPGYAEQGETPTLKSTYLVAGLLENNQPFLLYVNGLSYNKMWPLQDELRQYKRQFPLFAFKVKLVASKDRDLNQKYAPQPVVTFEIVKDTKTKQPVIEGNPERVQALSELSDRAESMISDLVYQTLSTAGFLHEAQEWSISKESQPQQLEAQAVVPSDPTEVVDVNDDIPF